MTRFDEIVEHAMANSNDPDVSEFAGPMAELADGPPQFLNLDVVQQEQPAR